MNFHVDKCQFSSKNTIFSAAFKEIENYLSVIQLCTNRKAIMTISLLSFKTKFLKAKFLLWTDSILCFMYWSFFYSFLFSLFSLIFILFNPLAILKTHFKEWVNEWICNLKQSYKIICTFYSSLCFYCVKQACLFIYLV